MTRLTLALINAVSSFSLEGPHGLTPREEPMHWPLFCSTFSLIFIAELPDKTALATLLMATKEKPLAIFCGVAAAFVVQSIVAVVFGSLLGLLPENWVHLGVGVAFLGFAVFSWLESQKAQSAQVAPVAERGFAGFRGTAWKAFVVIFIAE